MKKIKLRDKLNQSTKKQIIKPFNLIIQGSQRFINLEIPTQPIESKKCNQVFIYIKMLSKNLNIRPLIMASTVYPPIKSAYNPVYLS